MKISFIPQFWESFPLQSVDSKENITILLGFNKDFMYLVRRTNRMPPRAKSQIVAFLRDTGATALPLTTIHHPRQGWC